MAKRPISALAISVVLTGFLTVVAPAAATVVSVAVSQPDPVSLLASQIATILQNADLDAAGKADQVALAIEASELTDEQVQAALNSPTVAAAAPAGTAAAAALAQVKAAASGEGGPASGGAGSGGAGGSSGGPGGGLPSGGSTGGGAGGGGGYSGPPTN
ncbi:hypothetical protein ACO2Q1_11115 [Brevundimonas sp. VNH65]|uniref:hypothetical protein n=1 Tax=Brevundimonas sp. VNH65 TaxID=3400917 RepID=UPI003C083534